MHSAITQMDINLSQFQLCFVFRRVVFGGIALWFSAVQPVNPEVDITFDLHQMHRPIPVEYSALKH